MKNDRSAFSIDKIKTSACAGLNQHLFENQVKVKKKSKFGANKKVVDGITFDSEREAKRYGILKMRRKAGEIGLIELQVPFELNPGGEFSYKYIADFVYRDMKSGEEIVEDSKGFLTVEYKKKRKLMKKVHGITILET
jgi:hypothetical protein